MKRLPMKTGVRSLRRAEKRSAFRRMSDSHTADNVFGSSAVRGSLVLAIRQDSR
jgi:hypothetical protein